MSLHTITEKRAYIYSPNTWWARTFYAATPTRRGEMFEALILNRLKNDITQFSAGFKTTFDGFTNETIDQTAKEHFRSLLPFDLQAELMYYDLHMKYNVFGPTRSNQVLVDVKYSDVKPDLTYANMTDLQKLYAATEHCRWVWGHRVSGLEVSPDGLEYIKFEYSIYDTVPTPD